MSDLSDEKRLMILALQHGEELRRKTGRTTRIVALAVEHAFHTREPVVLVGMGSQVTAQMVKIAHEKIDGCLRGDASKEVKALVQGLTYWERGLAWPSARVFEDHNVTFKRAVEAIEKL